MAAHKTPNTQEEERGSKKVFQSLVTLLGQLIPAFLWDSAYDILRLFVFNA